MSLPSKTCGGSYFRTDYLIIILDIKKSLCRAWLRIATQNDSILELNRIHAIENNCRSVLVVLSTLSADNRVK